MFLYVKMIWKKLIMNLWKLEFNFTNYFSLIIHKKVFNIFILQKKFLSLKLMLQLMFLSSFFSLWHKHLAWISLYAKRHIFYPVGVISQKNRFQHLKKMVSQSTRKRRRKKIAIESKNTKEKVLLEHTFFSL